MKAELKHADFRNAYPGQAYRVREISDMAEWESYFGAIPVPHLMQSWPYGEAKQHAANWQVCRLLWEENGKPVAICQVLEKRVAGLRIISRINRGPLFFDTSPSQESKREVFAVLRARWKLWKGGPLLIAPALEKTADDANLLNALGYRALRRPGWRSARLDLSASEAAIRASLSSTWRNRLGKAQRSGLVLRDGNATERLDWLLEKHVQNMKEKKFSHPKPHLIKALCAARPNDFCILSAEHDGVPLAAMLLTAYGVGSEYYIGWFGAEGRRYNAGNFLYWYAMLKMKNMGYSWLDVGGYDSSERFGHFKQGIKAKEYQLIGEWLVV